MAWLKDSKARGYTLTKRRIVIRSVLESIRNADLVVVGSGFFGATVAERVANKLGKSVVVIEKRNHIGGNAYSYFDDQTGIEVHKYGSHLFHTSSQKIWEYVNNFTGFNDYKHSVIAISKGQVFSLPFSLHTLSQIYRKHISPSEAQKIFKTLTTQEMANSEMNFEERAIAMVGKKIYNRLVKGYTAKQWQTDPRHLPGNIISRLPVRSNFDTKYFDDQFEGLPLIGYTPWINKMLSSSLIKVYTDVDFFEIKSQINKPIVYSGPLDKYFDYKCGVLSWRTLDFEFETLNLPNFQGNSVINYPDKNIPYTRIHEFKHLHPERKISEKTVIAREFSKKASIGDEPYYPVNSSHDRKILDQYRFLMSEEKNVLFGGRLGTYKYLDMHMAIASALQLVDTKVIELLDIK